MKTAIIGSRTATNYDQLVEAARWMKITEVISGGAAGADALAERYAKENEIPLTVIKAEWERHGKTAGPLRNTEIVCEADQVLALWDGQSAGTADTIRKAKLAGKPVTIIMIAKPGQTSLF